jgi:hypothetical protein
MVKPLYLAQPRCAAYKESQRMKNQKSLTFSQGSERNKKRRN